MGRPCAVALLVLLALPAAGPVSPGAAVLGRLLRQANLQEKAGCLQVHKEQNAYCKRHVRCLQDGRPAQCTYGGEFSTRCASATAKEP